MQRSARRGDRASDDRIRTVGAAARDTTAGEGGTRAATVARSGKLRHTRLCLSRSDPGLQPSARAVHGNRGRRYHLSCIGRRLALPAERRPAPKCRDHRQRDPSSREAKAGRRHSGCRKRCGRDLRRSSCKNLRMPGCTSRRPLPVTAPVTRLRASALLISTASTWERPVAPYAAWCFWLLGYPDQALLVGDEALAKGERIQHGYSRVRGLYWNSAFHAFRREWPIVEERAAAAIALARERGLAMVGAVGEIMQGAARAILDPRDEAVADMRLTAAWRWLHPPVHHKAPACSMHGAITWASHLAT